jgi:hypothetical protein
MKSLRFNSRLQKLKQAMLAHMHDLAGWRLGSGIFAGEEVGAVAGGAALQRHGKVHLTFRDVANP